MLMRENIRKVKSSDMERIKEIEKEAFPQIPYDTITFIAYWISYPDSFLVYDDGGGEVGVKGYIIFDPYDGHIISIAVDKEFRRKGIGSRLIKEALEKVDKVYVEVKERNEGAIEFYRSLGFEKVDRIPGYYVTEDALIMAKTCHSKDYLKEGRQKR